MKTMNATTTSTLQLAAQPGARGGCHCISWREHGGAQCGREGTLGTHPMMRPESFSGCLLLGSGLGLGVGLASPVAGLGVGCAPTSAASSRARAAAGSRLHRLAQPTGALCATVIIQLAVLERQPLPGSDRGEGSNVLADVLQRWLFVYLQSHCFSGKTFWFL